MTGGKVNRDAVCPRLPHVSEASLAGPEDVREVSAKEDRKLGRPICSVVARLWSESPGTDGSMELCISPPWRTCWERRPRRGRLGNTRVNQLNAMDPGQICTKEDNLFPRPNRPMIAEGQWGQR